MLEDLQTTERALRFLLPAYEDGGSLAPLRKFSGILSTTFAAHAADEDLSYTAKFVRLLDRFLPPDGQDGRLHDLFEHDIEFTLYNYFERMDVFWDRRKETKPEDAQARKAQFAEELYEFKKNPIDEDALAHRMLANYLVSHTKQPTQEQKEAAEYFAHMIPKIRSTADFTAEHFTRQHATGNYGEKSRIMELYKDELPDDTFSTMLAFHHYCPRTYLVGSMMETRKFRRDGRFFEGANFRGSDMRRTQWDLSTTSIRGAFFEGADLRGAKGLTVEALAGAYSDERTRLPGGLKYKDIARLHAELNMSAPPAFTETELRHMPKMA